MSTKVALYARCSLLLNQDPMNQVVPMREWAKIKDYEIYGEYVDHGISGVRERRPQLDRLLADARRGKFKFLCIAALDRLGRNVKHLLNLIEELHSYGVKLVSLREALDLSSPQGQLIFTILAAISQMERELISIRIKESLAAKKMAAKNNGTSWRCGRPPLNKDTAVKVIELRDKGKSIRGIALELQIGKTSVERILRGSR